MDERLSEQHYRMLLDNLKRESLRINDPEFDKRTLDYKKRLVRLSFRAKNERAARRHLARQVKER